MEVSEAELVNVWRLARELGLPTTWLRDQARMGRIPCLKAGRKMRFSPSAVRAALAKQAATQTFQGEAFEHAV